MEPAVVMGAETYDVDLGHGGRNSEKPDGEQGGGQLLELRRFRVSFFWANG
jgi:hypothetical protein